VLTNANPWRLELGSLLFLVPLAVLLQGVYRILNFALIRSGNFTDIAVAAALKPWTGYGAQLLLGLTLAASRWSLILGSLVGDIAGIFRMARGAKTNFARSTTRDFRRVGAAYRHFAVFEMPFSLANIAMWSLVPILIATFYSLDTVALFSLAERGLALPAALI